MTQNKKTITESKHMIFDIMIWFCYFCKKIVFFLGLAHDGDPIIVEVGPKNGNF